MARRVVTEAFQDDEDGDEDEVLYSKEGGRGQPLQNFILKDNVVTHHDVPFPTDMGLGGFDEYSDGEDVLIVEEEEEEDEDGDFKGYYADKGDEEVEKYFDEETGAHFEFFNMVERLNVLKVKRSQIDKSIAIEEQQRDIEDR